MGSSDAIHITAEATPNPNTVKLNINRTLVESGTLNYTSKEKAQDSLLATRLFENESIAGVMIGRDFISLSKKPEADWQTVAKEVDTIGDLLETGEKLFPDAPPPKDEATNKIEEQIRQILDNEIRPAVARDGGDIEFYDYNDGIVTLHLQGACSSCPSATMTLKMGVENRLKSLIPEVKEVVQL